jgi:ubiquinone/menaquinone biosynthesis C-methylase UbiE/DNA-binding MarR family transcriptional regulator
MNKANALVAEREGLGSMFDHMATLSDPLRCRLLLLLERHELTVSEMCAVLQLPQSTVSRHLKTLADAGWAVSRRDGTSRYYSLSLDELDTGARRLWPLIREQVASTPGADQDERRLASVLERRRSKSAEFFSSASGQWDHLRADLFGSTFHLHALLGLLDPSWRVADLGCGTGQLTAIVAPHVREVIGVDGSADMLHEARRRFAATANVDLRLGTLEALPIDDGQVDVVLMALVLHHLPEPGRALKEAARILRRGGRVLIIDMLPHDRVDYQQAMGHVWLGFGEEQMAKLLGAAGFTNVRVRPLPVNPDAKGPALFVAVAGAT